MNKMAAYVEMKYFEISSLIQVKWIKIEILYNMIIGTITFTKKMFAVC